MQGGKCITESFHNILDHNQQSVLSASNVNHSTAWWGNLLNSGRQEDTGKPSSAAQDQVYGDDLTLVKDWFAPTTASSGSDAVHRDQPAQLGVPSESESNHSENQVFGTVPNLSVPGSDRPRNTESRGAYSGSSDGRFHSTSLNSYPSGRYAHQSLAYDLSLNNHGASSSSSGYLINNGDKSGSSLDSSGKRKAPDGGHAQLYAGRSSSSHLQSGINFVHNTIPASPNASGSVTRAPSTMEWPFIGQSEQLNLRTGIEKREIYSEGSRPQLQAGRSSSSPLPADNIMQHTDPTSQGAVASITTVASPIEWSISQPEHLNLRIGIEERETYSEFFPPPNITDIGEGLNAGQQEPNLFVFPFTDTALGHSSGISSVDHPSRSSGCTDASLIVNSNNSLIQSHEIRVPENTGGMLPSDRSGSLDTQSGRPLKSLKFSGGISTTFQDAQNSRISLRNHSDVSASDTTAVSRRLPQDSPAFNLASGNTLPSESLLPHSRSGSDLSMQNHRNGWTPPQNFIGPNQQGVSQFSPQLPSHPPLRNYRRQRGYSPVVPPNPSSLTEGVIPSFSSQGLQNQSSRSALLIGEHTVPTSGQHGLAVDIETRQRLVRQVRNTMQRSVNRRTQNVTIGAAELHDRHRGMRLDIDNMSYEELLALEDRIGNVCTGLSDEVIMRSMKRRKHLPMGSSSNSEPCCICQDEFVAGDDIGATVCKHEFHFKCIKQWLSLKNTCPVCKKTALDT